jgi:2-polyprenyl-3-methyl-5-hydroxy-6-metoxy-1,4-benzoquinol methylase
MPSGAVHTIFQVLTLIHPIPNKKILDIGCGYGKFGLLFREYLNIKPEVIDAVEAWKPYIDKFPWLNCIYDNVYNEDATKLTEEFFDKYDTIIMNDVIEHMDKTVALNLLSKMKGSVIISTPQFFFEQEFENNPFEHHISHWTLSDFGDRLDHGYVYGGGVYARLKPLYV